MNLSQKITARIRELQRRDAVRVRAEAERYRPKDVGVMARSAGEQVRPARHPAFTQRPAPEVFERGGIIPSPGAERMAEVSRVVASCGISVHQLACPTGHAKVVPVYATGLHEELVAHLCADCDAQLPADWERGDVDHGHREVIEVATYMPDPVTRIECHKEEL